MTASLTKHNHKLDEVVSALQKSIRRGLEEDALYWAAELHWKHDNILWKRLLIIASEDVGMASPSTAILVRNLYANYCLFTSSRTPEDDALPVKDKDAARLFLIHAVLALARAKKSRQVDHATILAFHDGLPLRQIPDYAKDKHTGAGARQGRGFDHFFEVGAKLENEVGDDPYRERAKTLLVQRDK